MCVDKGVCHVLQSYAGKYVPSIGHYIVQAKAQAEGWVGQLSHLRHVGEVDAPRFILGGVAIGNGFTGEHETS
jgi:vitellogenic carboxypeptidase-like protein